MDELIRKQDAVDAVNRALDRETLLNRLVRRVAIDAIRIVPPVQSDVPDIYAGELISRQAAMERLMAQNVIFDGSEYHDGFNAGVNRAQEVIRNLPTVQTEIIHCKNCAFYEKEIGGNDGFALGMCKFIEQHYVANEGFCFWAKKRGDSNGTD